MTPPLRIRIVQDADLAANLLSLPLLHSLGRAHPQSRLCLEASADRRALFAATGLPFGFDADPGLDGTATTAVLDLRIPRAAGPGAAAGDGSAPPTVAPPDGPRSVPLWCQYLALAERCGLGAQTAPEPPYFSAARQPTQSEPRVLFAVDASDQENRWAHEQLAALQGALRERDIDLLVMEVSALSLLETAALIGASGLLLTNQRALLCLGAALGIPVIGLLSLADEPKFYAPFGRAATLLVPFEKPLTDLSPLEVAGCVVDHLAARHRPTDWQSRQRLVFVL